MVVGVVQVPTAIGVELPGPPVTMITLRTRAHVTVNDAGGSRILDPAVTWESSDDTVLTVDASGVITGVGTGSAVVRVRAGSLVAQTTPVTVLPAFVAAATSVSGSTSCALTPDRRAYCWGTNEYGQVGSAAAFDERVLLPQPVSTQLRFQAISMGVNHGCAVATDATAWCWGLSSHGALGSGSIPSSRCLTGYVEYPCSRVPVRVEGGPWRTIAAGAYHTCAINSSDETYCWGANNRGQLGAASPTTCPLGSYRGAEGGCALSPVQVAGGPVFASVTTGFWHTCALTNAGAAWCWGSNYLGELGNGTTAGSTAPVPVAGGLTFARIDVEHSDTCGLTTGGAVYCWGYSYRSQGGGSTPVNVGSGGPYVDVRVAGSHTCALTATGAVWCWQLHMQPAALNGGHAFTSISGAESYTCGVRAGDGILFCWGPLYGEYTPWPVRAPESGAAGGIPGHHPSRSR
jgi:alpha-tubulin suppressor-like RCC1 family protein